jgi:hypothetical protein
MHHRSVFAHVSLREAATTGRRVIIEVVSVQRDVYGLGTTARLLTWFAALRLTDPICVAGGRKLTQGDTSMES